MLNRSFGRDRRWLVGNYVAIMTHLTILIGDTWEPADAATTIENGIFINNILYVTEQSIWFLL